MQGDALAHFVAGCPGNRGVDFKTGKPWTPHQFIDGWMLMSNHKTRIAR